MGLPSWIKRLRAKARRKEAIQSSARPRADLRQQLYLRDLEARRVLNGDMQAVQLDAGQYANDNQADTFVVYRQGDELAARVNGDVVWTAPLTDVNRLTISGSQDDDTFILDASVGLLGLPGGIEIDGGGNAGQGHDVLVLQSGLGSQSLSHANYHLQAAGAGSIQWEAAGTATTHVAEVRFVGVESVTDSSSAASRSLEFTVDQNAWLSMGTDGGWQFRSAAGDRFDVAAPTHSLTVAASGTGGLLEVTGQTGLSTTEGTLVGSRPLDLTIDAQGNRLEFSGSLHLDGGNLTARSQAIDVQGDIVTHDAAVTLAAVDGAQISSLGRITDIDGHISVSGSEVVIDGTLDARHGQVTLDAGAEGTLLLSGGVDVSGLDAGQSGGQAQLLGARVALLDGAWINASGQSSGGQVLMGGDAHGANPDVRNAQYSYVAAGAMVTADALTAGNGGRVVVWADLATRFYGQISARGGAESGDGGWVEVSGSALTMRGSVDLRAPNGVTGTLLLDPLRVVLQGGIGDGSDTTASGSTLINNPGSNLSGRILFADEGAGSPNPFIITEQEIEDQSLTASIVIEGRDRITVSGVFNYDGDGASADDPGSNVLLIQGGNSLTLRTRNDSGDGIGGIDLTGVPGLTIKTTLAGSILLHTGVGGSDAGAANIKVGAIATSSGGVTIISEGTTTLSGVVTLGGSLSVTAGGVTQINANLTASGMTFNGVVSLTNSVALASAGLIDFKQTVDGAFDLTLSGAGSAIARGKVGNSTALGDGVGGSLNLNMTGAMTFEDTVRTLQGLTQADGAVLVTFRENVTVLASGTATTLNGNVTLDGLTFTSAGAVTFGNTSSDQLLLSGSDVILTISGLLTSNAKVDGPRDLVLNTPNGAVFNGAVGATTAIGDGLGASIQITSIAGPTTFSSTVRTEQGLTQHDTAKLLTFRDNVYVLGAGTASTLDAHTTLDGLTFTSAGAVTFGSDTFGDPLAPTVDQVLLTGDDVIMMTAGMLTFHAKVDGGQNLILSNDGETTFKATVGATTAIGNASGSSIQFAGSGPTTFESTVRAQQGMAQSNDAGLVTFRRDVNVLGAVTASAFDANVTLDGLTFTSAGAVTFGNASMDQVTLSSSDVIWTIAGLTTSNAKVDGGRDLLLNTSGGAIFNAAVGSVTEIGDGAGASIQFTALAGPTTFNSTLRTAVGLTQDNAAGLVTFRDNVSVLGSGTATTLNAHVTLDGLTFTSAGAVTFGNTAVDQLLLSSGDVTLAILGLATSNAKVDGGQDLILNSSGATTFNVAVGATTAIGDASGASIQFTGVGTTTFNSTVQTQQGFAQSDGAGLVTLRDNLSVLNAGTASSFDANLTLDGLTFASVGDVTFGNAATDQVLLSGGDVILTIGGLTTSNSKVDGPRDLVLNTSGGAIFNAMVGATTAIGDGVGATIQFTALAGATTFNSTLRTAVGMTQDNVAGRVTFRDNVNVLGAATATTLNANTTLDGLTFTSAGAVTFGNASTDQVLLSGGDVTLAISGLTTSNAQVDGAQDLILNNSGAASFNAVVGGGTAIGDGVGASIQFTGSGTTTFNSTVQTKQGLVQSNGAGLATFRENVNVLGAGMASAFEADVTLDGLTFTSAGAVTFGNANTDQVTLSGGDVTLTIAGLLTSNAQIDGARDLVLNTSGGAVFNEAVGGLTAIGDGTGVSLRFTALAAATTFESTVRTQQGMAQDNAAGLVTFRDDVRILGTATATTFDANLALDGLFFISAGAVTFGNGPSNSDSLVLSGSFVTIRTTTVIGEITFHSAVTAGSTHVTVNSEAPETIFDSGWQFTTGRFDVVTGGSMLFTSVGIVRCDVGDIHLLAGFAAGELHMADGAIVDAGAGTMELEARGDVTIGQLMTTNPSNTALTVTSNEGAIIDGGDTGGADIMAPAAILLAQRGIGAGNALETILQRVAAHNANGRDITLENTSPELRISLLGAVDGVQLDGPSGNINVLTHGNLVVDRHVVSSTGGNLSLKADSDVTVNDGQTANDISVVGAGRVLLTAGRDLAVSNDVIVTSDSGSITLIADDQPGEMGGRITMQNRTLLSSVTGGIALEADGNVVTGQLVTGTDVMIVSTSGAIVDGHVGALEMDIRADQLMLIASRGIGAGDAFETSVAKVAALNVVIGDINIENFRDLRTATFGSLDGIVNSGSLGSILLTNHGNLFLGSATVVGSNVMATGGGDIELITRAGGVLVTNARVAATGGDGNITLDTQDAHSNLELQDSRQSGASAQLPDIQVTGAGKFTGNVGNQLIIGSNVLIQSATGSIVDVPPVLHLNATPQVSALGIATLSGNYGRPEETHFKFTVHWGKSENDGTDENGDNFYDGTKDGVITNDDTEQGRAIQARGLYNPGEFVFEHFYGSNPNSFQNSDNSAKDIDIRVRIDTDSNIIFNLTIPRPAQVDPEDSNTILPITSEVELTTFRTPGSGIGAVRIDTTPQVPQLAFPPVLNVSAVTTTTTAPSTVSQSIEARGGRMESAATERRRIVLRVVSPDQMGVDREGPDIELQDSVLADLLGLFKSLPDGHYRIYLKESITDRGRLVIDVYVRQGRPIDPSDESEGDRPPTAQNLPAAAPVFVEPASPQGIDQLWTRWGRTSDRQRLPAVVRAARPKPTPLLEVDAASGLKLMDEGHEAATGSSRATALLVGGAIAAGANGAWEDRVDAAFKKLKQFSRNKLSLSRAARVRRQLRK